MVLDTVINGDTDGTSGSGSAVVHAWVAERKTWKQMIQHRGASGRLEEKRGNILVSTPRGTSFTATTLIS